MNDILIWILQAIFCAPVFYVGAQLYKSQRKK